MKEAGSTNSNGKRSKLMTADKSEGKNVFINNANVDILTKEIFAKEMMYSKLMFQVFCFIPN